MTYSRRASRGRQRGAGETRGPRLSRDAKRKWLIRCLARQLLRQIIVVSVEAEAQFAPRLANLSKRNLYVLAGDETACRWIRRLVAGFAQQIEQMVRRPSPRVGFLGESLTKRQRNVLARSRRRDLRETLIVAGFRDRRVLAIVERLSKCLRDRPTLAELSVLRQLPAVFRRLRREVLGAIRRSTAPDTSRREDYVPPGATTVLLTRTRLATYLRLLAQEVVLYRDQQLSLLNASADAKRPRGRGPGIRPDPDTPRRAVDLTEHLPEVRALLRLVRRSPQTGMTDVAALGWLFEVSGIWSFHFLHSLPDAPSQPHPVPTPDRPFWHPSVFGPCAACRDNYRGVRSCSRRRERVREFIKDYLQK